MCNYLLHLRDQFLRIYENIPAIIFKESDIRDLILSSNFLVTWPLIQDLGQYINHTELLYY